MKKGDIVEFITSGATYASVNREQIKRYVRRYEPINVRRYKNGSFNINSGYGTEKDLASNKELTWKIRYVFRDSVYIVQSNLNHVLVTIPRALRLVEPSKKD